jgi:hypothetical protein
MTKKSKSKETILFIVTFIITSFIQNIAFHFNICSLNNLFINFISWIIIFCIVYIILRLVTCANM